MAAIAYKTNWKYIAIDANGRQVGLPYTMRTSSTDVNNVRHVFTEDGNPTSYTFQPLPKGAVGYRFTDVKSDVVSGDCKVIALGLDKTESGFELVQDQTTEKAVDAHARLQGLDTAMFVPSQRIFFVAKT